MIPTVAAPSFKEVLFKDAETFQTTPLSHHFLNLGKNCATSVLTGRVQKRWQESLLIAGTAIAIACIFISLFFGSLLLSASFLLLGLICCFGAYSLHYYANAAALEKTNEKLRETQAQLEKNVSDLEGTNEKLQITETKLNAHVSDLEGENTQLKMTNHELNQRNEEFIERNRDLQETNGELTIQVSKLSLLVNQLKDCGEHIQKEVEAFKGENEALVKNRTGFTAALSRLNNEITTANVLQKQISSHMFTQQNTFDDQLQKLSCYLDDFREELRTEGRTMEKFKEISTLRDQIAQEREQLGEIKGQYQAEAARLEEVGKTLEKVRDALDNTNSELSGNVQALSEERKLIHALLSQIHASSSTGGQNKVTPQIVGEVST